MKYKTHINITKRTDDGVWLVEGIEYPNLITDGSTLEDAINNAVDAWSFLCVLNEDKGVEIVHPNDKIDEVHTEDKVTTFIESEDTNEYREYIDYQDDKKPTMPILSGNIYDCMEWIITNSKVIFKNCDTLESIINNNKKTYTTPAIDNSILRCIAAFYDCRNDIDNAYLHYRINLDLIPSDCDKNLKKLLKKIEGLNPKMNYYISVIDFIVVHYKYNGLGKRDVKTFINRLRKLMNDYINKASLVKSIVE